MKIEREQHLPRLIPFDLNQGGRGYLWRATKEIANTVSREAEGLVGPTDAGRGGADVSLRCWRDRPMQIYRLICYKVRNVPENSYI